MTQPDRPAGDDDDAAGRAEDAALAAFAIWIAVNVLDSDANCAAWRSARSGKCRYPLDYENYAGLDIWAPAFRVRSGPHDGATFTGAVTFDISALLRLMRPPVDEAACMLMMARAADTTVPSDPNLEVVDRGADGKETVAEQSEVGNKPHVIVIGRYRDIPVIVRLFTDAPDPESSAMLIEPGGRLWGIATAEGIQHVDVVADDAAAAAAVVTGEDEIAAETASDATNPTDRVLGLFTDWHRTEVVGTGDARMYAQRLLARLRRAGLDVVPRRKGRRMRKTPEEPS